MQTSHRRGSLVKKLQIMSSTQNFDMRSSCLWSLLHRCRTLETASISSWRVFWRSSHSPSVMEHFSFSIIRNSSSAESEASAPCNVIQGFALLRLPQRRAERCTHKSNPTRRYLCPVLKRQRLLKDHQGHTRNSACTHLLCPELCCVCAVYSSSLCLIRVGVGVGIEVGVGVGVGIEVGV